MSPSSRLALIAVLLVAVAVGASQAWHWTPTFDEPNHLEMGRRILEDGDWSRFDNSKMPVSVLNAAPALLAQEADPRLRWWLARLPQLGWLCGAALLVFAWARRFAPPVAAVGAAALAAWDPNLLAHGALVTTDLPCTFFVLACSLTLLRTLERPTHGRAALAGLAFGLAQAVKFTSAFLLPVELLITAGWCLARRTLRPLEAIPVFALAAWVGLNGAYAFQGTFSAGEDIAWQSETFAPLSHSSLPLPFPRPWLEGLDWVKADDDRGHGNIYVDGVMTPGGQRDYFLRAAAWKLPLGLLLLAPLGLLRRRPSADDLALLVPPAFFLAYFSLAFNFQLGLRYVLPVLPFLALLVARLPTPLVLAAAGWSLLSGLTWWPWGLSYFNERLTDRSQAWRHLADSNLDWGHTGHAVQAWKERHPEGLSDPEVPAAGDLLLSANALTGVLGDPARFACFREQLPPDEHLAYAHYAWTLTLADLEACFPTVEAEGGEGSYVDGGEHVVALLFRGEATLRVGDLVQEGRSSGETLLVALVRSETGFGVQVEHDGPQRRLYVDGRELER